MLTRDYKHCGPGEYYHIYNRGNAREDIFLDSEDYGFFLLRVAQNLNLTENFPRGFRPIDRGAFSLIAYCLMPNHFHFLLQQNSTIPTSKLIGKVCTSYSMYFNKKYRRVGHIFQDQFKQKNIPSNRYLLALSSYIHLNPVDAKITTDVWAYKWSSIREYSGLSWCGRRVTEPDIVLDQIPGKSYLEFLRDGIHDANLPNDLLLD